MSAGHRSKVAARDVDGGRRGGGISKVALRTEMRSGRLGGSNESLFKSFQSQVGKVFSWHKYLCSSEGQITSHHYATTKLQKKDKSIEAYSFTPS